MALVSGAEVASLRRSALQQTAAVDARALADVARRGEEERFRGQMNGLLGLSAACVGVYVYLKLQSLSKEYPTAYAWWDNAQLEGPEAEGEHSLITVPSAARRVEFPALYYAQTMIMAAETLPLSGAEFLLSMATHFSKFMNPVHWNGSPAQLRRTYLDRFLPRDARGKEGIRWSYVWSAWRQEERAGRACQPVGGRPLLLAPGHGQLPRLPSLLRRREPKPRVRGGAVRRRAGGGGRTVRSVVEERVGDGKALDGVGAYAHQGSVHLPSERGGARLDRVRNVRGHGGGGGRARRRRVRRRAQAGEHGKGRVRRHSPPHHAGRVRSRGGGGGEEVQADYHFLFRARRREVGLEGVIRKYFCLVFFFFFFTVFPNLERDTDCVKFLVSFAGGGGGGFWVDARARYPQTLHHR